jgi:RimJ/RimL family protein N-acetyltransferase
VGAFEDIRTQRLLIRKLFMADKEALFGYRSLPEVWKYQSWRPTHIGQAEAFIRENAETLPNTPDAWMQLAVCLPDGRLIGDIGVHFLGDGAQAEIGYTLHPDYQGGGYATEAVRAILGYLFRELGKHRVTASVDPDNLRSILLLQRIGFRQEAHFIKSFWMDGQWLDDCVFAMLEEEWAEKNDAN